MLVGAALRSTRRGAPALASHVRRLPHAAATGSEPEPKRRMLELALVRHGQSEGNLAYQRSREGDHSLYSGKFLHRHSSLWRLTDRGRSQAAAAGSWLRREAGHFDAFYTSEYLRAMETAALLRMPGATWYTETNCRERDWGSWDLAALASQDASEVERRKRHGLYFAPSGGESLADVLMRVDLILTYLHGRYHGRKVLMVCHGELMWAFRLRFEKLNQIQYRDMADAARGEERINNGSILRYSRADPDSGEVNGEFRFMQLDTPWADGQTANWTTFRPTKYSNEDLLGMVNRFPRYVNSANADPVDDG